MLFKTCLLAVAAALVSAQDPAQQSALLALATALPPSVLAQAATNQAAFASDVAASIAAGKTPEWYQALPTDVKAALASIYPAPAPTPAPTTAYETASSAEETETAPATSIVVTSVYQESKPLPSATGASSIGVNGTAANTVNMPTLTGTGSPQPSEHTGAAALPTQAIGAGIAGVMAFAGLLAL